MMQVYCVIEDEVNGLTGEVGYVTWPQISYVGQVFLGKGAGRKVLAYKAFGNGVSAEDFVMDQMTQPLEWLILKAA